MFRSLGIFRDVFDFQRPFCTIRQNLDNRSHNGFYKCFPPAVDSMFASGQPRYNTWYNLVDCESTLSKAWLSRDSLANRCPHSSKDGRVDRPKVHCCTCQIRFLTVPIVGKTSYLGVIISYRAWETDMFKHRIIATQTCFRTCAGGSWIGVMN